MSERPRSDDGEDSAGGERLSLAEEEVRRLLYGAGPRPPIPAADRAAIETAARREWTDLLRALQERRRARRTVWQLAVAASLFLAVAAGWWWKRPDAPANPPETLAAATVERFAGDVRRIAAAGIADILRAGEELFVGDEIELAVSQPAPPGRRSFLALRLAGGTAVRVDEGTRLRFASSSTLELRRGALYVDSGALPGHAGQPVEVHTGLGIVSEIGTQFEVRLEKAAGPSLRVRVREGSVLLRQEATTHPARAGEEVIARTSGAVERHALDPHGDAWSWVLEAAPALDIENVTLQAYLDWLTRETGWNVRFADAALERESSAIRLHGTIEGLRPDESVRVVLPGSGLGHRIEGGVLRIFRPASP